MPNFITKILIVDFLSNFKVTELEHEFELGDLDCRLVDLLHNVLQSYFHDHAWFSCTLFSKCIDGFGYPFGSSISLPSQIAKFFSILFSLTKFDFFSSFTWSTQQSSMLEIGADIVSNVLDFGSHCDPFPLGFM